MLFGTKDISDGLLNAVKGVVSGKKNEETTEEPEAVGEVQSTPQDQQLLNEIPITGRRRGISAKRAARTAGRTPQERARAQRQKQPAGLARIARLSTPEARAAARKRLLGRTDVAHYEPDGTFIDEKKDDYTDIDPKVLAKKFEEKPDANKETLSTKKKSLGTGETIEISPELEHFNQSSIMQSIRSMVNRTFNEGVEKVQTPGQEGPIEDALDYEKYNAENPLVPNDEVDAMLEKGSEFYKEDRNDAYYAMKDAEKWHDSKHGDGSFKSKPWGTRSIIQTDHKKHVKKQNQNK